MVSCHLVDYFGILEALGTAEKDNGTEVLWNRKLLILEKLNNGRNAARAIFYPNCPTYIHWLAVSCG